jgi:hypothetical protein
MVRCSSVLALCLLCGCPSAKPPAVAHPETTEVRETGETEADQDADMKQCPVSLASCPATGCAIPGNGKARSNEIKHGDPAHPAPTSTPIEITLATFAELQTAADKVVPQGEYPPPDKREGLRGLTVEGKQLGEGTIVALTGYVHEMRAEGPESVNCKIDGVASNDFHISIVADPGADEFHGIVVEMIPQDRPSSWTTHALHDARDHHTQVRIVGPLFYDSKHVVNPGPHAIKGQPKRFSLWEIHPVRQFFVCTKPTCDPASPSDWHEWN